MAPVVNSLVLLDEIPVSRNAEPGYSSAAQLTEVLYPVSSSPSDDTTWLTSDNVSSLFTTLASLTTDYTSTDTVSTDTVSTEGLDGVFNVTSPNSTDAGPTQFPYHMLGFTAACAFIIAILGASGNLLTIIALPMCRSLRTTATAFVVNLAVVELLFCVFVLPLSGAQYAYLMMYDTSLLSDRACIYFTVMRYALTQVELQCIVAIALMRALAVSCTGFYARVNRPRVVGAYIALLWIYSFALKIPTALGVYGHYRFNYVTMECDMGSDIPSKIARVYMMLYEAIIPVIIIILLYIFIFVMVKLSSRRVSRASTTKRAPKVAEPPSDVTM